jgi:hypothetical protein
MANEYRDRDVRNAIQELLQATSAFDGVYLWGPPKDYGSGASNLAIAWIEPGRSNQLDKWDGGQITGIEITSSVKIVVAQRMEDPQLRDEAAELLVDIVANAIQGQSLSDLTLPDKTRFINWTWVRANPPERQINISFEYIYLIDGWNNYNTTP